MPYADQNDRYLTTLDDWPRDRSRVALKVLAALFVVGLIVGLNVVLWVPRVRGRAEVAVLRAQSTIKKLQPHPRYIPTPVATTPAPVTPGRVAKTASTPERTIATSTPAATATAVPTPTPDTTPLPPAILLENDCHEAQGWNNCGPATLSMALRFYGWTEDQYAVASVTKPDKDDKNVSPKEMVAYTLSLGDMVAVMGYATDTRLLKQLLNNGFPVIVETWFIPEPDDEMGHYRLLTGYDDATEQFTTQDAYNGADQLVTYDELETLWKVFNRVYIVVCEAERAAELTGLLAEAIEPDRMHRNALAISLAEIEADPDDRYAWFNLGTNHVGLGQYAEAAAAYDRARTLNLPWRLLWYQFGPFEAYLQVGRYQDVIDLADANLKVTRNLEESYYYRALARHALGDQAGAREDLQKALRYNPYFEQAAEALSE